MALLRRDAPSELPESQVEYRDPNSAKRWIMLLIYFIVALAIAVLVVLAGRWVYHKVHHTSNPNPTPVAPQGTNRAKTPSSGSANNNANKKSATNNKSNKSGSSSSAANNGTGSNGSRPAPSPGALPNNGPGDVIALFVGTSLVAAGIHYAAALRRAQDSL